MDHLTDTYQIYHTLGKELEKKAEDRQRENQQFQNSVEMCHELAALKYTLERQESGCEFDLQKDVLEKLKNHEISLRDLASKAKDFLQEIIMYKKIEKEGYKDLDPELLYYSGLDP